MENFPVPLSPEKENWLERAKLADPEDQAKFRTLLSAATEATLPAELNTERGMYYGAEWRLLPLPPDKDAIIDNGGDVLIIPRGVADENRDFLLGAVKCKDAYSNSNSEVADQAVQAFASKMVDALKG